MARNLIIQIGKVCTKVTLHCCEKTKFQFNFAFLLNPDGMRIQSVRKNKYENWYVDVTYNEILTNLQGFEETPHLTIYGRQLEP